MRKRCLSVLLIMCVMLLCGCSREIRSPADELCIYSWSRTFDNGNTASLRFEGDNGCLSVENDDFTLDICGIYAVTDDSLLICDRASHEHFTFGYRVYGDRIELQSGDGVLELYKE